MFTDWDGFDINIAAVIIAQLISFELDTNDMVLLGSFLYTVADCLNTIADVSGSDSTSD